MADEPSTDGLEALVSEALTGPAGGMEPLSAPRSRGRRIAALVLAGAVGATAVVVAVRDDSEGLSVADVVTLDGGTARFRTVHEVLPPADDQDVDGAQPSRLVIEGQIDFATSELVAVTTSQDLGAGGQSTAAGGELRAEIRVIDGVVYQTGFFAAEPLGLAPETWIRADWPRPEGAPAGAGAVGQAVIGQIVPSSVDPVEALRRLDEAGAAVEDLGDGRYRARTTYGWMTGLGTAVPSGSELDDEIAEGMEQLMERPVDVEIATTGGRIVEWTWSVAAGADNPAERSVTTFSDFDAPFEGEAPTDAIDQTVIFRMGGWAIETAPRDVGSWERMVSQRVHGVTIDVAQLEASTLECFDVEVAPRLDPAEPGTAGLNSFAGAVTDLSAESRTHVPVEHGLARIELGGRDGRCVDVENRVVPVALLAFGDADGQRVIVVAARRGNTRLRLRYGDGTTTEFSAIDGVVHIAVGVSDEVVGVEYVDSDGERRCDPLGASTLLGGSAIVDLPEPDLDNCAGTGDGIVPIGGLAGAGVSLGTVPAP